MFQLLNDPETFATLEESSDLKFMLVEDYQSQRKELDEADKILNRSKQRLETCTAEAAEKQKEIDELKAVHESVITNPIFELDKWCGSCRWGVTSCDGRVDYMAITYKTRAINAKIVIMGDGSCKK